MQKTDDIQIIKELVESFSNSGKAAWEIGRYLKEIKENPIFIPSGIDFSTFVKAEFGLSLKKAESFIKIFETFKKDEIPDSLLAGQLYFISSIDDPIRRNLMIQAIKKFESENIELLFPDNSTHNRQKFRTSTLKACENYLKKNGINIPVETVKNIIIGIREEEDEIKKENRFLKVRKQLLGLPLHSFVFPNLNSIIQREPVDEMGVVSLFCVMFDKLKNIKINLPQFDYSITFESIKYIREKFPDACIECSTSKNKRVELNIEFEFESSSYVRHKHHADKENNNCDLIVCWENNWKNKIILLGLQYYL